MSGWDLEGGGGVWEGAVLGWVCPGGRGQTAPSSFPPPPGAMQAEELTYLAVLGTSIPAGVLFHGGGEMWGGGGQ